MAGLAIVAAAALLMLRSQADEYRLDAFIAALACLYCVAGYASVRLLLSDRTSVRHALTAVLAATVLLRLAVFLWLFDGHPPKSGDASVYVEMARRLSDTGTLRIFDSSFNQHLKAFYPPLYIFLLAGVTRFASLDQWAVLLLNLSIDVALVVVLAGIGRAMSLRRAGVAAGMLFALWPSMILSSCVAQKETLGALLALVVMASMQGMPADKRLSWKAAWVVGAGWAALSLTQPSLALLPLTLAPLLLSWPLRHAATLVLRIGLIVALLMSPWWIRNYVEFDRFVPLTSASGWTLWVGNNPDATGRWMAPTSDFRNLPELEMSALGARKAVSWIESNPVDFLKVTTYKAARALGGDTYPVLRVKFDAVEHRSMLGLLGSWMQLWHVALMVGSLLLVSKAVRHGELAAPAPNRVAWLLVATACYLLALNVWFEFHERHRYVLTPVLCLLIGVLLARAQIRRTSPAESMAGWSIDRNAEYALQSANRPA